MQFKRGVSRSRRATKGSRDQKCPLIVLRSRQSARAAASRAAPRLHTSTSKSNGSGNSIRRPSGCDRASQPAPPAVPANLLTKAPRTFARVSCGGIERAAAINSSVNAGKRLRISASKQVDAPRPTSSKCPARTYWQPSSGLRTSGVAHSAAEILPIPRSIPRIGLRGKFATDGADVCAKGPTLIAGSVSSIDTRPP